MGKPNWANKTIWTGDCLSVMRGMNSESVDLIYLAPPFNSKTNYAAPIGSKAAGAAFKDTWTLSDMDVEWSKLIEAKHPALSRVFLSVMTKSDKAWLVYMAARVIEMRRLLKPNGSLYLHCDPMMSHYLKLVLEAVFGRKAFRHEIVWCYRGGGVPKDDFAKKHALIFRYARGHAPVFNLDAVRIPYSESVMESGESRYDKSYRSNKVYKGYKPNKLGKHPEDWWPIQPLMPSGRKERTGYPTPKPLALLSRIIQASSHEERTGLDPFCGCATTPAADLCNRHWAGIDISPQAAELVVQRIEAQQGLFRDILHRTDIPKRTDLGPLPRYNCEANRKRLYGEQAGHCARRRTHFEARHLEVAHIIAQRNGGTDDVENLQLLSGNCNRIKGDRGMDDLHAKLQLQEGIR